MSSLKAIELVNKRIEERTRIRLNLKQEKKRLAEYKIKLKRLKKVMALIQSTASMIQERTYEELTTIVSKCLTTVFQEPYEFKLEFLKRKGRTDAIFYFYRNGIRVDPMRCGGTTDIASMALRLAVLLLQQRRKFLWADEPFKQVDEVNMDKIPQLIKVLSEQLKMQFVLITHDKSLAREGNIIHIT